MNKGQDKLRESLNLLVDEKGNCQMKLLLDKITPDYLEYRKAVINGQTSFI